MARNNDGIETAYLLEVRAIIDRIHQAIEKGKVLGFLHTKSN